MEAERVVVEEERLRQAAIKAGISLKDVMAYQATALGCLGRKNPIRRFAISLMSNPNFDRVVVFFIVLNCVFLAMNDPLDKDNSSVRNQIVEESEIWFTVVFSIEMVVKIVAMGFVMGTNAYLSDRWNWIDFVVVAVGWVSQLPDVENLSALRTFRVLRPLRTLTTVPGMRVIVQSMLASIPALANVFMLCVFIFFIFGIIGVQLWAGVLRGHCAYQDPTDPGVWLEASPTVFCALDCPEDHPSCSPSFGDECGTHPIARFDETSGTYVGEHVPMQCMEFESPKFDLISFDNIGFACLTIFTSITLEGWVDVMYALNHAWGIAPFNVAYFVLLIMFGSFFLLNLALAVIWDEYVKAEESEKAKREELERIAANERAMAAEAEHERIEAAVDMPADGPDGAAGRPIAAAGAPRPLDADDGSDDGSTTGEEPAPSGFATRLVLSNSFNGSVVALILLNTLCLALEFYDMPIELNDTLRVANYVFTALFTFEMVIKLIGLGVRGYAASFFNLFDGVIVIISLIEVGVELAGLEASSGLSALRTFRLMRVFKLARSWEDLRRLLTTIMKSVADVANASVVLLIVMFIFCLLGMQLFGGNFDEAFPGDEKPRAHFDNIWWAFVTVFQVLTGENWNEVLYFTVHAVGGIGVAYFVLLSLVGNYLILNLFLAILLGNFDSVDEDIEEEGAGTASSAAVTDTDPAAKGAQQQLPASRTEEKYIVDSDSKGGESSAVLPHHHSHDAGADAGAGIGSNEGKPQAWGDSEAPAAKKPAVEEGAQDEEPPSDRSFFVFAPDNAFRVAMARVKSHKGFESTVLTLIAVSSIMLALDEPRISTCKLLPSDHPDSCVTLADFLFVADWVVSILFGFEMLIKMVAMGAFLGPNAYIRNPWNKLDFVIVVVSFLSLGLDGDGGLKALRSLRALRALRPLRVVSRYPQLKLVVNSIFGSLPKVRNVGLVNGLFFLIFGIVGVQNWMGALSSCNDGSITYMEDCVGTFNVTAADENCEFLPLPEQIEQCQLNGVGMEFPRVWGPPPFHFDHVGAGLLTVFEVASGEMWPDIMYVAVDSVGVDQPLQTDYNPAAALYFICINVVCAFFMLEIFTGVVIDNFNKMKEESQGSALLTEEQQMWVETMKMMLGTAPRRRMRKPPAKQRFRNKIYKIASSKSFELLIMSLILVNSIVLATRHADQTQEFADALDVINRVFSYVFAVEAALKIFAFGPRQYASVGWNRFDFILVIGSFVGEVVNLGQLATLLRIVRVARVFRLVRTSQGLLTLFKTLLFSFPSLVNVGTVLLLVYFIYAVVAMNLFADIRRGEFLTEDANFESFFVTMITLFRMSTGESYNGIMHDCMVEEPYCIEGVNCGIDWFPPIYFVSFFVLTSFILLNLLVAIILDNFNDTVAMDEGREGFTLTDRDMEMFQQIWSKYDPGATRFIPVANMVNVLLELNYPLGLKNTPGVKHSLTLRKRARGLLIEMEIPEHEGRVHFHEALTALARHACGAIELPDTVPILNDLEKQQSRIMRRVTETSTNTAQHIAAEMVQQTYRGQRLRVEEHRRESARRLRQQSGASADGAVVPMSGEA